MRKAKINTVLVTVILIGILSGCPCEDCGLGIVKAKFFYINQTQDTILFHEARCFGRNIDLDSFVTILPNDTLIIERITEGRGLDYIDQAVRVINSDGGCKLKYSFSKKCDYWDSKHPGSFSMIKSYEIRKLITRHDLEFTYFFTEAKKANMGKCQ